jgi:hypothetical protein
MTTTRGERLRTAREKRFKSARSAAKALGIAISTYGAHERAEAPGGRDYGPNEAQRYGRFFGVTPEWLLTGLDEVDPPRGSTEDTVAVEIRGESLGAFFNRWLVFYDDVRRPVTPDLIGELCVVGLEDGRVLIKQVQRSRTDGLFNLISSVDKPILDVAVEWAAKVNSIARRGRA